MKDLRKHTLQCFLIFTFCGCATAPQPSNSATVKSECFIGTIKLLTPDNQQISTFPGSVVRMLDPKQNKITEFIKLSPQNGRETHEVTINVVGDRMNYVSQLFSGTGILFGEPWKWTRWETQRSFKDGHLMKANETLHDGVWTIAIDVFKDDQLVSRFDERFERQPMSECEKF